MSQDPRINQCIEDALAAANAERGDKISKRLVATLNAFADLSDDGIADSAEIAKLLAPRLQDLDSPSGIGKLAVWIGAIVEKGADPADTLFPLVEVFMRLSRTIPELNEEDDDDDEKIWAAHAETLNGMERLGQSIVSHLSRGRGLKELLEGQPGICAEIKRVSQVSLGADWLLQILEQRSGELLVLHGIKPKGFRVAYENISNCFHLFTLLQAALEGRMPGAGTTSAKTIETARGLSFGEVHDRVWWDYLRGTRPHAKLAEAIIYGEANPSSIENIDGEQVIVLGPVTLARGWDGGFFSPLLKVSLPDVRVIGELTGDEVSHWRERIGLNPTAFSTPPPAPSAAPPRWSWLPWKRKR